MIDGDWDRLRLRVRAARRAGSAPLLVFGLLTVVFAGYQGLVGWYFVPAPLYWPLCGLVALVVLWGIDRVRQRRSGVGPGRLSYGRAALMLVAVLVAGNVVWFLPILRMLLWPASVLTVMALRQGDRRLAWRSGIIGFVMILAWFADMLILDGHWQPVYLGAGGVALAVAGLIERRRERGLA